MSTGELETLLHTEGQISEYFVLETLLVSTRTADLYKARDKSRATHIFLWIAKQPLVINSGMVRDFLYRMGEMQRIDPPIANIVSYGVDSAGVPFCIFGVIDGFAVTHGNTERAEAERRYMACLRILERVHAAGLECGDLCGNSFWVERSGEVRLIGVMGSFEKDLIGEKIVPFNEVIPYLSPEQKNGAGFSKSSDVYALGVLGYRVLSGKLPFETEGSLLGTDSSPRPLSAAMISPPIWGEQVFSTCLNELPSDRYSNAGAILGAIAQIRENILSSENAPARLGKEGRVVKSAESAAAKLAKNIKTTVIQTPDLEASKKSFVLKSVIVVGFAFIVSFLIFKQLFFEPPKEVSSIQTAMDMHGEAIKNEEIKVAAGQSEQAEKEAYYKKMVMSDDPVFHDILIKSAMEAKQDSDRQQAENAILDRARRLGLRRSSEIVRPWLRTIKTGTLPESYSAMLRALDVTLPVEARNAALRQAYAAYPRIVLKLTASLALDTGKFDQYQPVLAQLVGDANKQQDVSKLSLLALILYNTELVSSFGDDAIQKRESIPDADLVWLLNILAQRNDFNVRAIASLAVDRKLLPPIRQFYLASIRDRENLPTDILNALVKASAGVITPADILNFANWFDRSSEDILLALCADATTPEARTAAFDMLAGKSLVKEPAATMVKWVKDNAWEKRAAFVEPIGIITNLNFYEAKKVSDSLKVFDPFVSNQANQKLVSVLLDSEDPRIAKVAVQHFGPKLGIGRRLRLLENPDKDVRILGLKSLADINDIVVQKLIIDHYNAEKDADVRKAYSETYLMISEREKK